MKVRVSLFTAAVFVVASTNALAQQASAKGGSTTNVATGEQIFKKHCAECHEPAQDRAPQKEAL
jgi:mono/diheme cytochrome c family protein